MPFSGNRHSFDSSTLKVQNDAGSVYGLFKGDLPFRPDHYICLLVGQTNDLRTRLLEHYNDPSIAGVTHFVAEASATEQQRKLPICRPTWCRSSHLTKSNSPSATN